MDSKTKVLAVYIFSGMFQLKFVIFFYVNLMPKTQDLRFLVYEVCSMVNLLMKLIFN